MTPYDDPGLVIPILMLGVLFIIGMGVVGYTFGLAVH